MISSNIINIEDQGEFKMKPKIRITVFVTRKYNLRARIEEINKPTYEVTIGGEQ